MDPNIRREQKPAEDVKSEVKQENNEVNIRMTSGVMNPKESEEYKAALVGGEVGDPMKTASGPAVSSLMKQCCLLSLVFSGLFASTNLFGF